MPEETKYGYEKCDKPYLPYHYDPSTLFQHQQTP